MAEKEERILCIETDEKIVECGYGDFYSTISRKESIERMAKAIKSVPKASGEAVHSTDYAKWAEAALNALLEEK